MAILAVAASLALVALPVLLWVRSKSNGEEPGHHVNQVTWVAALVLGGAAALSAVEALSATIWNRIDLPSNAWLSSVCLGALIGLTIYVSIWVALFRLAAAVHRWSFRLPPEHVASWRDKLLVEVYLLLATVFGLAFAVVLGHAATTIGLPIWAVVPLVVAILPLYQTFALPWLAYLRAPRLASRNIADVEAWLENLRRERGLPSFHVRVQEGRLANAFATGGLGAHLVVIGGRLLERMSRPQLCAVLAHEVAHVVKRHVPRLVLPLTIVGTSLHVLCVISFANPLFDREGPLSVAAGAALAGAFAGLFVVVLPGFFMRRMEFQADRVAVEMLGDGELLVDALTKLAELNKQPLDARSWSHPTMQARIDAIRALARNDAPN